MTTQVQADMAVKALTDEELDAANGGFFKLIIPIIKLIDLVAR